MSGKISTVILGATGYVGGEFLRLIPGHPAFELAAAVSESCKGERIADTFPHLASAYPDTRFAGHDDWIEKLERGTRLALFSAAPHGAAAALVAAALAKAAAHDLEVHVVDASADFRYRTEAEYTAVYGGAHGAPELLEHFTCAVPEHAASISTPHVGHPGCFATTILLATVPLAGSGLAEPEVFVSAITGSTGSGRSPQAGTHHPERHSNLYAYKSLAHRHAPEIAGLTEAACGRALRVHFVPHSGPYARGIHATVHARAAGSVKTADLLDLYREAYRDAPFIEVVEGMPRLKSVVASNRCQVGVSSDGDSIAVMSTLDNLVKGAAGGAMQWMNRLWDLPDTDGLTAAAPAWT